MKRIASLCLMAFLTALGGISLSAVTFEPGLPRLPIGNLDSVRAVAMNQIRYVGIYVGLELHAQFEAGLYADRYWIENNEFVYFHNMGAPMTVFPYSREDGDLSEFVQAKTREHINYKMNFWEKLAWTHFDHFNDDPYFQERRFLVLVITVGEFNDVISGLPPAPFFSGHLFTMGYDPQNGSFIPEDAYRAPNFLFGTDFFTEDMRNLRVPVNIPYVTKVRGTSYPLGQTTGGTSYSFPITEMKDPRENLVWFPEALIARPNTNIYGSLTVRYDRDIECVKETFDIVTGEKICPSEFRIGFGRSGERTLLCVTGPCAPLVRLESSDDMKSWSTFSVIADFNGLSWTLPPGLNAPSDHPQKFFRAVAP